MPLPQPLNVAPHGRRIALAVLLASILGATFFLASRQRPLPAKPLPEVHRKNLELRADGWYTPGTTTRFTGFLLDTYEEAENSPNGISRFEPPNRDEASFSPSPPREERRPSTSQAAKIHAQWKSRSSVSNGLLHGLSQGWYTNGQQQVEEHFVAGISDGLRTKWHPNGQKLSEVTIVNGKLQGTFRSWHENGAPAEEVNLNDGQPDGLSKAYFPSGFLKSQVTLRNGKVIEKQFYKDGEYREPRTSSPGQLSSN